MDFTNKTALITGASVGIGRAVALKLAQNGAKVVLFDINYEKLDSVKKEIEEYTKDVLIFECDISDENKVYECVAEAEKTFGGIDILVNNAAIWRKWSDFVNTPTEEWRTFFEVNVMGTVYVTKAVLPKMIEKNNGRIINVSSVAGVYGNARMAHYSATKGAIISLTKSLAKELSDKGILVNSVSPGSVSDSSDSNVDSYQESDLAYLGRTGTNAENANLICFLASDDAGYITGENIKIDGCRRRL